MILRSVYLQLEQTTSVAESNIPYSEVINLDVREYGDGDIIIEDGTYGTEVYKLCQTEQGLEVLKKDVRVGMITKPGEYFGEMSFIQRAQERLIRSVGRSVVGSSVQDGNLERLISEIEVANGSSPPLPRGSRKQTSSSPSKHVSAPISGPEKGDPFRVKQKYAHPGGIKKII